MEKSRRVNLNDATHAEALYSPSGSTTAVPSLQNIYNPPRYHGEVGWICPVCGRGLAPSTSYCTCYQEKTLTAGSVLDPNVYGGIVCCGNDRIEVSTTLTN